MGDYFGSYRDASFTETHVDPHEDAERPAAVAGGRTDHRKLCQRALTAAVGTSTPQTTGFSYAIGTGRLSSASVTGSDLPATTCTYDPN
jgi:hypothetical protein